MDKNPEREVFNMKKYVERAFWSACNCNVMWITVLYNDGTYEKIKVGNGEIWCFIIDVKSKKLLDEYGVRTSNPNWKDKPIRDISIRRYFKLAEYVKADKRTEKDIKEYINTKTNEWRKLYKKYEKIRKKRLG
jgi:hypothetical protein